MSNAAYREKHGQSYWMREGSARHASSDDDPSELIERYFEAYTEGNIDALEALLASDFVFSSPDEDHVDRRAFLERCVVAPAELEYVDIKIVMADTDAGMVLYEGKAKGGGAFRRAELFSFDGDRIRSIEVFAGRPPKTAVYVGNFRQQAPTELTPSGV